MPRENILLRFWGTFYSCYHAENLCYVNGISIAYQIQRVALPHAGKTACDQRRRLVIRWDNENSFIRTGPP